MSRESKSLKKSRSDWLNSGNALIEHLSENAIFVCPRFLRYAEAQGIRDVTLKCLLTPYFTGNIPVKKYQNQFTCVNVITSQMWDAFLKHGVV